MICPAGAASTAPEGRKANKVIQEDKRRVLVFMRWSHRKMKRPGTTPSGEPGLENQKARQDVWPLRYHLWVVVESDLALAAKAPATTTPAVTRNKVAESAIPVAAVPPAPAAAPPAAFSAAKTPVEKAAINKPKASFFILAPLNDENAKKPVVSRIMLGKNSEWQVV